jgi:DNA-binding MltR family transcriptional regulator
VSKKTLPFDEKLSVDEREAFYDHSSDRAAALVLGTMVEDHLTVFLRLVMRREKALADELFNPSGPLGAFGTKIRLAYMLRLIAPEIYKDLIVVNKIRNKFAHDLSVKQFESQQITDLVKNMHMYAILCGLAGKYRKAANAETKKGIAKNVRVGVRASTFAFALENDLRSTKDSYRYCIRNLLHFFIDREGKIKEAEAEMNKNNEGRTTIP